MTKNVLMQDAHAEDHGLLILRGVYDANGPVSVQRESRFDSWRPMIDTRTAFAAAVVPVWVGVGVSACECASVVGGARGKTG